jgi:hypothetical protein
MAFTGASQGALGVIAGYTSSYSARTPYLTLAEYQNAPTAIDTSNLIEGGTQAQQNAALTEIIGRASSWIDTFCCGAQGSLCATLDSEVGRVVADKWGRWIVKPRYWPVLEVRSFAVGSDPSTVTAVTLTPQNTWIEEQGFQVGGAYGLTTSAGPLEFGRTGYPGQTCFAAWQYVNGWANTTLAASAAQSATSIELVSTVGVYPGSSFQIYDAPNDETVTVAATYVEGDATVPLAAPLASAHSAGISVSALPPAIKQAAILLTSALIKARGDTAIVLDEMKEPSEAVAQGQMADEDKAIAAELLAPFVMVWGQR